MKIFAVNMEHQDDRRRYIVELGKRYGLDIEIINAVNGKLLDDSELSQIVSDYPSCLLTKGEVGCALSHLKIYKRMVEENIPLALILEDDAIFDSQIHVALKEITQYDSQNKPNVYLLSKVGSYIHNYKRTLESITIYRVYNAFYTYGYIINKYAAENLLSNLYPIRFEADRWEYWRDAGFINLYCTIPNIISTNDDDKSNSSIEEERKIIGQKRVQYYSRMVKKDKKTRWKRRLWRAFIKPILCTKFLD